MFFFVRKVYHLYGLLASFSSISLSCQLIGSRLTCHCHLGLLASKFQSTSYIHKHSVPIQFIFIIIRNNYNRIRLYGYLALAVRAVWVLLASLELQHLCGATRLPQT